MAARVELVFVLDEANFVIAIWASLVIEGFFKTTSFREISKLLTPLVLKAFKIC